MIQVSGHIHCKGGHVFHCYEMLKALFRCHSHKSTYNTRLSWVTQDLNQVHVLPLKLSEVLR